MHLPEDHAHPVYRHGEGYPLPPLHLDQDLVDHKVTCVLGERRGKGGGERRGDVDTQG